MSHSEWELLTISEDIEVGDTVYVEDENGDNHDMVYVGTSKKGVKLLDVEGETRVFSQDSLEEIGGYCVIAGKSDNVLSAKEIMRRK